MINPKHKRLADPLERDEKVDTQTSIALALDMIGSGKRVLEVGATAGDSLRLLVAAGNRVTAIEADGTASDDALAACEAVVAGDLDLQALGELVPGQTFDVALFGDVLEQLRDPRRVLEETRRFLAPGGFAVLSVSNVAHGSIRLAFLRGRFDAPGGGPLDRSYRRLFTLKNLHDLCFRAGFRVVEIARVKAPVVASEGPAQILKPDTLDREILREIETDPEHDTYRFVVRAAPLGDDERLAALVEIAVEAEMQLGDARGKLARVEGDANARVAEYERANEALRTENASVRAEASAVRLALERAQEEVIDAREHAVASRRRFDLDVERLRADVAVWEERAAAAREVADEANRERDAAFAARDAADAALRTAGRDLNAAHADVEKRAAAIEDLRFELEREAAKLRDVVADRDRIRDAQEAQQTAAAAFFAHVEAELSRTRREILHIDGMIRAVQSSKWWTLKRALGKAKRIAVARLRR